MFTGKESGSSLGEKETSKNSTNEPSLENIQEQEDEVIGNKCIDMSSDEDQELIVNVPEKAESPKQMGASNNLKKKTSTLFKSYNIPNRKPLFKSKLLSEIPVSAASKLR
jgi:hypothetical protein